MQDEIIQEADGFLLVYSITSLDSFDYITTLHQKIVRIKKRERIAAVIVANKRDLEKECRVGSSGKCDNASIAVTC
jgi:GTPase SAR1 family protein